MLWVNLFVFIKKMDLKVDFSDFFHINGWEEGVGWPWIVLLILITE